LVVAREVLEPELSHATLRKKPFEQSEQAVVPLLMKKESHWRQVLVG
jgi:hypothetical protein